MRAGRPELPVSARGVLRRRHDSGGGGGVVGTGADAGAAHAGADDRAAGAVAREGRWVDGRQLDGYAPVAHGSDLDAGVRVRGRHQQNRCAIGGEGYVRLLDGVVAELLCEGVIGEHANVTPRPRGWRAAGRGGEQLRGGIRQIEGGTDEREALHDEIERAVLREQRRVVEHRATRDRQAGELVKARVRPGHGRRRRYAELGGGGGVSTTAAVYRPNARLDELAGLPIARCAMLNNPTLFAKDGTLYLVVECLAFVGTTLDLPNSSTQLFATAPGGSPSAWTWRHVGVLADHALAKELGDDTVQQPDVSLAADGTPILLVTPAHANPSVQVGTMGDGCVAVELASIDPPALARDCAGRAVIRARVSGARIGACTHDSASATGIVSTSQDAPGGNWKLRASGAHP